MKNIEDGRMAEKLESMIHRLAGPKSMDRDRPYSGQPQTATGVRGSRLITGLTDRDLYDCMIRGYILSHSSFKDSTMEPEASNYDLISEAKKGPFAQLNANDMFGMKGSVDPLAVIQNTLCEVEKLMGIFPDLPNYKVGRMKDALTPVGIDKYIAESGRIVQREETTTHPTTGAELNGNWVLRRNKEFVDCDWNLHDLLERNNIELI